MNDCHVMSYPLSGAPARREPRELNPTRKLDMKLVEIVQPNINQQPNQNICYLDMLKT